VAAYREVGRRREVNCDEDSVEEGVLVDLVVAYSRDYKDNYKALGSHRVSQVVFLFIDLSLCLYL
jgi:hypothetical protein